MISRVWSPELLKMSGLKGFLIFLGAIALLGTVVLGLYPQFLFEQAEVAARTLQGITAATVAEGR